MAEQSDDITSFASFAVVQDPASIANIGETIRLEWVRPTFGPSPARFARPVNWQMFEGSVLSVTFSTPNEHRVLGSAVMVAPGVALTVNHVVEDHLNDISGGNVGVMCTGIASHGAEGWKLRQGVCVDRTDICILSLEYMAQLPPTRKFHHATLSTRTPRLGERLTGAGFRAEGGPFARTPGQSELLTAGLLLTSGEVIDIYQEGRGSLKPWPALGVDCPTPGGMSGGPVFDDRGFLVGLISSSVESGVGVEPSPTFVALCWPALGQRFLGTWPPTGRSHISLLELAATGACYIEKPESVEAEYEEGRTTTRYITWS